MNTVLNVIWLILSGLWLFLGYVAAGILLCITIIGIPFGIVLLRSASRSCRSALR
ncbi:MAG TPA: YccF domain-containing protein [Gemmatimonadales bacterium]|jgi:Predicted membrane protein|nr:YccF domain-containing protein [Gemmatimonadales bacterium]